MNSSLRTSSILLLLAGGLAFLAGPGRPANAQEVQASVMPGLVQVPPGEWFPVAVIFDMQPHWHINTENPVVPSELGSPEDFIRTAITVTNDSKLRVDTAAIQWPEPEMVSAAFMGTPAEYGVFSGRAIAYVPVQVVPGATPGQATMTVKASWQACDDKVCLAPEDASFPVKIAVDPNAGRGSAYLYPDLFAGFDASKLPRST